MNFQESTISLVRAALVEDVGTCDLTSTFFVPANSLTIAWIVPRSSCVLAGSRVCAMAFLETDASLKVELLAGDGDSLSPGNPVIEVQGSTRSILTAERTALNFLQQLSGVASLTAAFVAEIEGTGARILDTRKTIPGLRHLQKEAVRAGGGTNHRFGLFDMAMLKDNHLAAMGANPDLAKHILSFRAAHPGVRVEVEADTPEQAMDFFQIPGVDVVLLDNMQPCELRRCVAARPPGILLEASGGITLKNAREIAETGVDFLSVGALTHSAKAVDFGLDFGRPDFEKL